MPSTSTVQSGSRRAALREGAASVRTMKYLRAMDALRVHGAPAIVTKAVARGSNGLSDQRVGGHRRPRTLATTEESSLVNALPASRVGIGSPSIRYDRRGIRIPSTFLFHSEDIGISGLRWVSAGRATLTKSPTRRRCLGPRIRVIRKRGKRVRYPEEYILFFAI
ncbi:hypothetical protein EVAR_62786_1 [Eumeta japonica]|uniref:Uncharacterized protein n=1 Tax=Eumeta variegata TaxID=151549 RepID=A0A4C1Z052_EUMVA|nr:hypothetical protein EVAR_62786_1 [Eumeta japonica]